MIDFNSLDNRVRLLLLTVLHYEDRPWREREKERKRVRVKEHDSLLFTNFFVPQG